MAQPTVLLRRVLAGSVKAGGSALRTDKSKLFFSPPALKQNGKLILPVTHELYATMLEALHNTIL